MAELLINCDESGRSELANCLNNLCVQIPYRVLRPPQKSIDVIFNDVYYEIKSASELETQKAFQAFYDKQIISCSIDLYFNVIRAYSVIEKEAFILKISNLINDIYSPIDGSEEEIGLLQEHRKYEQSIAENQQSLNDVEEKIRGAQKQGKSNFKNSVSYKELENQHNTLSQTIATLRQELADLRQKIIRIEKSVLAFMEGLLSFCKINPHDITLENVYKNILLPILAREIDEGATVRTAAYKCLILYSLHYRHIFEKHQGEFYGVLAPANGVYDSETPAHICLLKGVCDLYLVHMFQEQQVYQLSGYDYFQLIIKYGYMGQMRMRQVAIFGLFKIFNYTVSQENLSMEYKQSLVQMMVLFIVASNDARVFNHPNLKIASYINYFFRCIVPQSEKAMEIFEKGLEITLAIIDSMRNSQLAFNHAHLGWNIYSSIAPLLVLAQERLVDHYLKSKQHPEKNAPANAAAGADLHYIEIFLSFLIRITNKQPYFADVLRQFLSEAQIIEDFTQAECQIFLRLIQDCEQQTLAAQSQVSTEIIACKASIESRLNKTKEEHVGVES